MSQNAYEQLFDELFKKRHDQSLHVKSTSDKALSLALCIELQISF